MEWIGHLSVNCIYESNVLCKTKHSRNGDNFRKHNEKELYGICWWARCTFKNHNIAMCSIDSPNVPSSHTAPITYSTIKCKTMTVKTNRRGAIHYQNYVQKLCTNYVHLFTPLNNYGKEVFQPARKCSTSESTQKPEPDPILANTKIHARSNWCMSLESLLQIILLTPMKPAALSHTKLIEWNVSKVKWINVSWTSTHQKSL